MEQKTSVVDYCLVSLEGLGIFFLGGSMLAHCLHGTVCMSLPRHGPTKLAIYSSLK